MVAYRVRKINLRSFMKSYFVLSIIKVILKHFYSPRKDKNQNRMFYLLVLSVFIAVHDVKHKANGLYHEDRAKRSAVSPLGPASWQVHFLTPA